MALTRRLVRGVLRALGALAALSAVTAAAVPSATAALDPPIVSHPHRRLCPPSAVPGRAACHARIRTDDQGQIQSFAVPVGFGPADLQSAYGIDPTKGAGQVVAIVDAQDDPTAESDLALYRTQYGLPPCTTANGCFRKLNEAGAPSPLPSPSTPWSEEIALDLAMASAGCPACNILLVEANAATSTDLGTALSTAVSLGANVVSNSFGSNEVPTELPDDALYYNHPGVAIFASAGDQAFTVEYPASSPNVIAVGGTSLQKSATGSRGWKESAWRLTGAGCSQVEPKPLWQSDTGCPNRTLNDIAAVADPNTGVAVYSTALNGWAVFGGTSASSPLVAAIYASAGSSHAAPSLPYAHPEAFFDVTSGSDAQCTPAYLCTAAVGYDGPTGNGTPNARALTALASAPAAPAPASSNILALLLASSLLILGKILIDGHPPRRTAPQPSASR